MSRSLNSMWNLTGRKLVSTGVMCSYLSEQQVEGALTDASVQFGRRRQMVRFLLLLSKERSEMFSCRLLHVSGQGKKVIMKWDQRLSPQTGHH